jgi:hypothetical protein
VRWTAWEGGGEGEEEGEDEVGGDHEWVFWFGNQRLDLDLAFSCRCCAWQKENADAVGWMQASLICLPARAGGDAGRVCRLRLSC